MFQFLTPIWFFAAAAILIPVVIHLWNIRPGKVLKVGSTSLITAASRRSSRSFKFLDVLLLILRCLLLILIALLLALPVLEQRIKAVKTKGWVMLPKENFSEGYQHYKKSIDSLTKLGYEFHYFNTGLPKASLVKLFAETKNIKSIDTTLKQPSLYWNLLGQVDKQVPADMPVYLYTTNALNHFSGEKAQVNLNLHWQTFTPADSVSSWVQDAWFTANKDIRVVKGISKPSGIGYEYYNVQPDKGNSGFNVNVVNGTPTVTLVNTKSSAAVDTTALRIAIYTDHNAADAGYLKAALDAVGQYSQHKTIIKQYSNSALIPANQNWVFWLSEQAVPAPFLQQPIKILAYQAGKQIAVSSWISTDKQDALPAGTVQVPLFKIVNASAKYNDIIWHDGFGMPVLAAQQQNKAQVYHFFSRFNPTWNDLVWSSSFPKLMLQLMTAPVNNDITGHDRRAISAAQMEPLKNSDTHIIADKFTVEKELGKYFWLALIAIFFTERWLATKNKLVQSNG